MLENLAKSIKENQNIIEKKQINPIVEYVEKNSFKSNRIFSDIGEDSASVIMNDDLMLITTDRIKTSYITDFPFGAGFSAILVGVDDIFCCGGKPLAASIIISYQDTTIGQKLLEGLSEGSNKFQVPIIRGHTIPNGDFYELSSTIIGEIKKEDYISAVNARDGDDIILAIDFDGKIGAASKYYWDTVTFKSSETVLHSRSALNLIAQSHLANSSKDISNSGIFGTLLQLINYSGVGANVNITNINIPSILEQEGYDLETFSKMYLTTSFILTCPESNTEEIIHIFNKFSLKANVIGKITKDKNFVINNGAESLKISI